MCVCILLWLITLQREPEFSKCLKRIPRQAYHPLRRQRREWKAPVFIYSQSHTHLKRGCLFIASSGKKRDLEAPPSTGLGLNSGTVNPGQPNLQQIEEIMPRHHYTCEDSEHLSFPFSEGQEHKWLVNMLYHNHTFVFLIHKIVCDSSPLLTSSENFIHSCPQNTL